MRTGPTLTVAFALLVSAGATSGSGRILERAPVSPDPGARYLFYLHGRIIEIQGPEAVSPHFGRYEYRKILEAFADRGFTVVAEIRRDGAGVEFADATAKQVRGLLEAGVPGHQITVMGFSKGGHLAHRVSGAVGSDDVSYVILAGCSSDPAWAARVRPRLRGRYLSLYDRSDRLSPSCAALFEAAEGLREKDEHVFDTGLDHGLFYRPRTDWVDRVVHWATRAEPPPEGPH